jgi:hypothetical protein
MELPALVVSQDDQMMRLVNDLKKQIEDQRIASEKQAKQIEDQAKTIKDLTDRLNAQDG